MSSATPYPILANTADFEDVAQVEKINTIVKGQYNHYLEKTVQKKLPPTQKNNLIRGFTNAITSIHDVNYGDFNLITMDFSTAGMGAYDTLFPVLKIKAGRVPVVNGVKPDISFCGVDKPEDWEYILNDYGFFVFSFNRLAQEYQISFRTYTKDQIRAAHDGELKPILQTGWRVTMCFYYHINKESR